MILPGQTYIKKSEKVLRISSDRIWPWPGWRGRSSGLSYYEAPALAGSGCDWTTYYYMYFPWY
jgi:hypothetical protein